MKGSYTQEEKKLICLLQEEFPLCERPYALLAQKLGLSEEEVLIRTRRLAEEGALKRIAAALYHQRAGYRFNSMLAWDIPQERIDEAGRAASAFDQVTHCYERERSEVFDYNLYTMVHETSLEGLKALEENLKERLQPVKYVSLPTVKELKKVSMKYFQQE